MAPTEFRPTESAPRLSTIYDEDAEESCRKKMSVSFATWNDLKNDSPFNLAEAIHLAWVIVLRTYLSTEAVSYFLELDGDATASPVEATSHRGTVLMTVEISRKQHLSALCKVLAHQVEDGGALDHHVTSSPESIVLRFQCNPSQLFETSSGSKDVDRESSALLLTVQTASGCARGTLSYSTSHFSQRVSHRLCTALESTLESLKHFGDARISDVEFAAKNSPLRPDRMSTSGPRTIPLCDLIANNVSDFIAIESSEFVLSYAQLGEKVEILARLLQRTLDYQCEGSFVPICFEKSTWAIVSMLAIQRAGAAFVPLDPSFPRARKMDIIEQTGAKVMLTSPAVASQTVDAVSMIDNTIVVSLSTFQTEQSLPEQLLPSSLDRPAYCLMTSGSSGTPKGVVVGNKAMATSILSHSTFFGMCPVSKVLQNTPFIFDPCLTEIYGSLAHGATLFVPSEDTRNGDLSDYINKHNVDWAFFTPSFARCLSPAELPSLLTVVMGGEAVTEDCVKLWAPGRRLINGYGPTEACCFSCARDLPVGCPKPANIGNPIGCDAYIVDPEDHTRLLPVGAPGELVLQGPILANGYLHDDLKTRAAFVDDIPWLESRSGSRNRVYKTGDLCRLDCNGCLDYLGRKDDQIKVRGQRLELGEVESALNNLGLGVTFTVDTLNGRTGSEKIIVAYFTPIHGFNTDETICLLELEQWQDDIRRFRERIEQHVPRYMVPELFLPISLLPLSPSGKLDRRVLRQTGQSWQSREPKTCLIRSQNASPTERNILKVWADTAGFSEDEIDLESNVLSWSDSIIALRVIRALRRLGIHITLAEILRHPTIRDMASHARQIAVEDRVWKAPPPFALLQSTEGAKNLLVREAARQCSVSEACIQDMYPCTPLQTGLAALSSNRPGRFVGTYVFHLPSTTDVARLHRAWTDVAAANPILRTRIVSTASAQSLQVVLAEESFLQDQPTTEAAIGTYGRPLSILSMSKKWCGPVILRWQVHHALYDGFCLWRILGDVSTAYANEKGPRLQRPPFAYFIDRMITSEPASGQDFWRSFLDGFDSPMYPPVHESGHMPSVSGKVSLSGMRPVMHHTGVTDSALIQATWALVLQNHLHCSDVVFGVTFDGRSAAVPGIDEILGPTLGTMPFRVRIDSASTIGNFLKSVQDSSLAASEHTHFGLQALQGLGSGPVNARGFQTLLVVQPPPQRVTDRSVSILSPENLVSANENVDAYPLTLEVTLEADGKWSTTARIDEDVIAAETASALLRQFEATLTQLANTDASTPLHTLQCIPRHDVDVIQEWNRQTFTGWATGTLHSSFCDIAKQQPDVEALYGSMGTFTYGQLDEASDYLATWLQQVGVASGHYIPLSFEKGCWCIVAMLGVLKAGAAFVPLDVGHPAARLQNIVQSLDPPVILTSRKSSTLWRDGRFFVVDQASMAGLRPGSPPHSKSTTHDPAYVIFTSGSTGMPKGVMVTHQAINTSLCGLLKKFEMSRSTRCAQFSSYAFDACIFEVFGTLKAGGTLCLLADDERLEDYAKVVTSCNVNTAFQTPTYLRNFSPNELPTLSKLIVGGESVDRDTLATWRKVLTLYNAYGPAETSVICAAHALDPSESLDRSVGVIGRPTAGPVWIVNTEDHTKLMPIGVAGELVVGGPILAAGYLGDPDKTAACFVQSPVGFKHGQSDSPDCERMYKTGDLCRWNHDGTLTHLGRIDTQVKIRGQRLEIGEIEARMVHNKIFSAAVVYPKEGPFHHSLVACLAVRDRSSETVELASETDLELAKSTVSEVRQRLENGLPNYMVPTTWIPVCSIPMQRASGKLDRKNLTSWVENFDAINAALIKVVSESGKANEYYGPTDDVQVRLQKIWCEVLNLSSAQVSVRTPFYSLGGADSITAMQVVARARGCGLRFGVNDLLRNATICGLSTNLEILRTPQEAHHEEVTDRLFPLSPIQKMYVSIMPDERHHFNQSFLLRMSKPQEAEDITFAMREIVKRHSMLRSRMVRDSEGEWSQSITRDVESSFQVFHHHNLHGDQAMSDAINASQTKLDMVDGPVIRAELMETHQGQHLLLVAHHFAIDLVSWRIILHELSSILKGHRLSSSGSVPYQFWCQELREKVQAIEGEPRPYKELVSPQQISAYQYWGLDQASNTYSHAVRREILLNCKISERLSTKSPGDMSPDLIDVIVAALVASFGATFHDRHLPAVHMEGHGRDSWDDGLDVSETVGWFTTVYPVDLQDCRDQPMAEMVFQAHRRRKEISKHAREAFALQQLSTEGPPALGPGNLPEITFNHAGHFQQLECADAAFERVPFKDGDLADMSSNVRRLGLFDVSSEYRDGHLAIAMVYNEHLEQQEALSSWLSTFERLLIGYAADLESRLAFPHACLPREELEQLLKSVDGLVQDVSPASSIQEHMLVRQSYDARLYRPRVVLETAARLALSPQEIHKAWRDVVAAHSVLRTVFRSHRDRHYQLIATRQPANVYTWRCGEWSPEDALNTPCTPWHKRRSPYALHILPRHDGSMLLLLDVSHSIVDATTLASILDDLARAIRGQKLPEPKEKYTYFARQLATVPTDEAKLYWARSLRNSKQSLLRTQGLPLETLSSLMTVPVDLSFLRHFNYQGHGITPSTLLRFSWARTLASYLSQPDVLFGVVNSTRHLVPQREVDGPCIAFAPCRLDVRGEQNISDALLEHQTEFANSLQHQASAAEQSHAAYDTIINIRTEQLQQDGLCNVMHEVASADPFDFTIVAEVDRRASGAIEAQLTYWTDRIEVKSVNKVAELFVQEAQRIATELGSLIWRH